MTPVSFTVIGIAEPKGSAKIVPIRRKFPFTVTGFRDLLMSVAVTSDNAKVKAWQRTVAGGARSVIGEAPPSTGAIALTLRFYVVPPQKIPAARGGLPIVRGGGDVDKFSRAILDALTGIAYVDDSQVIDLDAQKPYAATPAQARTEITITPIAIGLPFPETELTHGRADRYRDTRTPAAAAVPW